MANERRGILYETITAVALEIALETSGINGEIFWNEKPRHLSVVPDFIIGANVDNPTHVILVTASGASHNSHMKMWRNLSELQEAKAQAPETPTVISLYFKTEVKAGVMQATHRLYDSVLYIDRTLYHEFLDEWVNENLKLKAVTKEDKIKLLTDAMKSNLTLAEAVKSLAYDLGEALQQRNTDLDPLWGLMRKDYLNAPSSPTARTTSVKRGLGKLMVIEPHIRKMVYDTTYSSSRGIPLKLLPSYVFDLNFMTKSLVGGRLSDDEIRGVIDLLGPDTSENILQRAPTAMQRWIKPLRNLERVHTHVEFVDSHYDEFIDPVGFRELLKTCYEDPAGLSGEKSDSKVWVYEIVISLLKAQSGKLQGYGLAQLAGDTNRPEFGQGGFLIPPFVQRQKHLSREHLDDLASGLSRRFEANVQRSDLIKLKNQVTKWVIKENLEDRLIPYRNFEPLLWILESELEDQKKQYTPKTALEGWINEYAEIGKRSATTPFVQVGTTLIHWKTVSDSGKSHKKKELAARERSVRYEYDSQLKQFARRKGIDQTVLIVDGTFDDNDLRVLTEAGWNRIIYPDEIASFVTEL